MDIIRIYYNRFKNNPPPLEKAQKYIAIVRYSYFFSCVALAAVIYRSYRKHQDKEDEEARKLGDKSAAHRRLREQGVEKGTIHTFNLERGLMEEEFNRDVYLSELEKAMKKTEEEKKLVIISNQESREEKSN